ncbi:MAG: winged helix-turn-helix domain-containing protein [Chromatiaceae bacterium]|nr:winged helix-turn-helix domain-containing protein [Chromatiaceae bacterium]MCP5442185.1 winged helix-turn-helix domain-containing protein [Chromatiaceae bacterium]
MDSQLLFDDAAGNHPFRVGDWMVEPAGGHITRQGKSVKLEPKVMEVLSYLASRQGELVTRDEIERDVWKGAVISYDSITQTIIKLRKALGDDAGNSRYIQTVPKRGYRLTAVVHPASGNTGFAFKYWKKQAWFLAGGLVVCLLGFGSALVLHFTHNEEMIATAEVSIPKEALIEEQPTLTIQPFVLYGEDQSQAYLAQGLTHDLITDLSKLSGLWVISSRSVVGENSTKSGTARARYQISGDIQRSDGRIRVHVHLLDTETGHQIWSERYHQPIEDLFRLQEEISRRIVSMLSVKVSEAEQKRLAHRYTTSVPAYELFLQAQSLLLVRSQAANERARELYRQAIALDPSFARAYAGLALGFAADYRNQWAPDGREGLRRSQIMANTALQIDPEIPEVYWVLAYVSAQHRQYEEALGLLGKAVSLDQSFADAYALMGGIKTYAGSPEETPALLRTAIRLNPDAGYLYFLLLGRAYFFLGDWEQASINLNETLARNPENLEAHIYLAAVMESSGNHEKAIWEAEEIRALQQDFDISAWLLTYPMTDQGQVSQLLSALAPLSL